MNALPVSVERVLKPVVNFEIYRFLKKGRQFTRFLSLQVFSSATRNRPGIPVLSRRWSHVPFPDCHDACQRLEL